MSAHTPGVRRRRLYMSLRDRGIAEGMEFCQSSCCKQPWKALSRVLVHSFSQQHSEENFRVIFNIYFTSKSEITGNKIFLNLIMFKFELP